MKKQILASESFSASSKRHYFLDFKQAANNSHYIQFTRSEEQKDGSYKRWSFVVFQNHFEEFISAFSSLFQSAAYSGKGYQTVKDLAEQSRNSNRIKDMSPKLRPREKLFEQGAKALSQSELLAILLGSGSPGESALELAERILLSKGGRLAHLKQVSFADLCRFDGMGMAKSSAVIAALEIARRIYDCPRPEIRPVYLAVRPEDDDPEDFQQN